MTKCLKEPSAWSDLKLTLKDEQKEVTIYVHKVVLCLFCPYFQAMFNKFREHTATELVLNVPYVWAAHHIIQQFYHIETPPTTQMDWADHLALITTYNFFAMKIDKKLCDQLKVPAMEFSWLCQVVCSVGEWDDETIVDIIYHNLSLGCDLQCIPAKYLAKIRKKICQYELLVIQSDTVYKIQRLDETYCLSDLFIADHIRNRSPAPVISLSKKQITYYDEIDKKMIMQNYETRKIIATVAVPSSPYVHYANAHKWLVRKEKNKTLLTIHNVEDGAVIDQMTLPQSNKIYIMSVMSYLCLKNNGSYLLWDMYTKNVCNKIPHDNDLNFFFSNDGKMLIRICYLSHSETNIIIHELRSAAIVASHKIIHEKDSQIDFLNISWDNQQIALNGDHGQIYLYELQTQKLRQLKKRGTKTHMLVFTPDNTQLIDCYDTSIDIIDIKTEQIVKRVDVGTKFQTIFGCCLYDTTLRNYLLAQLDSISHPDNS